MERLELKIDRLTKQYGNMIAVDRLSFKMNNGIYGLLGANGAGKTTLMRMLCTIMKPTSGEIQFNGRSIIEMDEEYRDILGYLPQDFGYYPDFTVMEFLMYIASLKGLTMQEAKRRSGELLQRVGLSERAKNKVKSLSGGMRQRLGIAQAMINNPKILILDEPTAGLDPKERVSFRNMIAEFAQDRIVILSTHIVSDVEYIADEIIIMKKGCLLKNGSVEELIQSVKGKVYNVCINPVDVHKLAEKYCIANIHHSGGMAEVRIISDDGIPVEGRFAEPTLEDLYLYYFSDEMEEQI